MSVGEPCRKHLTKSTYSWAAFCSEFDTWKCACTTTPVRLPNHVRVLYGLRRSANMGFSMPFQWKQTEAEQTQNSRNPNCPARDSMNAMSPAVNRQTITVNARIVMRRGSVSFCIQRHSVYSQLARVFMLIQGPARNFANTNSMTHDFSIPLKVSMVPLQLHLNGNNVSSRCRKIHSLQITLISERPPLFFCHSLRKSKYAV
jgi:hypothetical protein